MPYICFSKKKKCHIFDITKYQKNEKEPFSLFDPKIGAFFFLSSFAPHFANHK